MKRHKNTPKGKAHSRNLDGKNKTISKNLGQIFLLTSQLEWEPICNLICLYHLNQRKPKPTKWLVRPAKTQISLDIRLVWSESSLCALKMLGSIVTYWAHSEDADYTRRMSKLIWVFAERTCHFVGFVMRWLSLDSLVLFNSE